MRMISGTGADHCYLARPRMYPITLFRAALLEVAKELHTPSLSELSALEDMGRLSAITVRWFGYSHDDAVQVDFGSLCDWVLLLGRACTRKGEIGGSDRRVVIRNRNGGN